VGIDLFIKVRWGFKNNFWVFTSVGWVQDCALCLVRWVVDAKIEERGLVFCINYDQN